MLLGDPRQSDQRTQSFHFPIVVHQSLDPAAPKRQAPCRYMHALRSSSARQAQSQNTSTRWVFYSVLRAVEVIICMITRDFSVISMTSQASLSLSLSLPLTKVTDAKYRKRFRASYNTQTHKTHNPSVMIIKVNHLKLRWDKINTLKTYCAETKFYNKMMHFCAITKSNECSLFACFESLQCPKIVLTVINKGVFFKSFRGAAPDPARGAYSAP